MSTQDVPGANSANADTLKAGCWAEHSDGSLIYVKGTEDSQVVYEIYDLAQDPPVFYQDAMRSEAFKKQFSFPPVGSSPDKWTWHDKTPMPWKRVMKTFDKPVPTHASVADQMTAAARVADSLRLRAQQVDPTSVEASSEQVRTAGRPLVDRLMAALTAFKE